MGNLLFSANGVMDRGQFTKAAMVLLAVNFFMWLAWFGGLGVGMLAGVLSLGLIYCWFAVFAKRLRDAGKSPAWFILILIVFILVSYVVSGILMATMAAEFFSPETMAEIESVRDMDPNDPQTMGVMIEVMSPMFKALAVPYAIGYLITGAAMALGLNALLKSRTHAELNF